MDSAQHQQHYNVRDAHLLDTARSNINASTGKLIRYKSCCIFLFHCSMTKLLSIQFMQKQCCVPSNQEINPDVALTELGSILNGMSVQEALASLEAAKAEVTRLTAEAHSARDAYDESANELEIAKKKRDKAKVNTDMKHMNSEEYGVDFSRTNRNDKNDYSQREFWERRYQLSSGKT